MMENQAKKEDERNCSRKNEGPFHYLPWKMVLTDAHDEDHCT